MHNCDFCDAPVSGRYKYCDDCRDTKAPWRVNTDNLTRACDHLDLTARVIVKRTATRKLLGRYHGIKIPDDAPRDPAVVAQMTDDEIDALMHHLITVSARMTPEAASRTLWHELTHAMQYERDPEYYSKQYAKELANVKRLVANGVPYAQAYRLISFEVEAKANEELHYTMFPLTLANKRVTMPALKRPHARISHAVNGRIVDGEFATETERYARRSIETAKQMLKR
jgi:hypothetical protein